MWFAVFFRTDQVLYFAGGFELVAPWGELQQVPEGYLLLNGTEVYGNNRETFDTSYEIGRREQPRPAAA